MGIRINKNTKILTEMNSKPIKKAIESFKRDIDKTCMTTSKEGAIIKLLKNNQPKESFCIVATDGNLEIQASDDLGFIYAIYEMSRSILGINELWFWNDQKMNQKEEYIVSDNYKYQSTPHIVKYRGWFVNDEVLLHTWRVNRRKEEPWEMVFETLLRLGGNMVIPGTDKNSEVYRQLASDMGLYITHHHAEPLGAEMFARAYPGLNPSYAEHTEKFQKLWEEGIEKQKDMKVIWNLGFRGQGDCPFWDNDSRYQTSESRGALISQLIKIQYEMVRKAIPDAPCCTNLYGETMELYRGGYLDLPEDIIKIWADNGYGKMVTRRQENHNPRICSLPEVNSKSNGIYYHVSFYDLQAANHMTMLPNSPQFVQQELEQVLKQEASDFWIINCSNVKPHVYFLDFIAEIWRAGEINISAHRKTYIMKYYGTDGADLIEECLQDYPKYALAYGTHDDEHAGEQFSNHVARILISQYMKNQNKRAEALLWLSEGETLEKQIHLYHKMCIEAKKGYHEYVNKCYRVHSLLEGEATRLFQDSILLQAQIHYRCFLGAYYVCSSLLKALEEKYQEAFYLAGKAKKEYLYADEAMRKCEHGKWHNFYENECLTDIKQTAWVVGGLMSYLRNLGEGPHFYQWQRDFLYSEEDRRVMLIMNMENHLKDEALFELMEEKWDS